jgi:hypothetical protein
MFLKPDIDIDHDIETKLRRFENICGPVSKNLGSKTRRDTIIKLCKTVAAMMLMFGSETWVHSQKEVNNIQTAEMRFLRKVKGCTRSDRIINEDIRA